MDLGFIVEGFNTAKGSKVKDRHLAKPPNKISEKFITEEPHYQYPTPVTSPTVEYGPQLPALPAYQPQMEPSLEATTKDEGQQNGRIPVISTIQVKGVIIDEKTRKFVCQVCNKEFIRKSGLVRHNLIHLGVRPNECQVCGRRFLQKSALTVHYRIHSGEKPYQCKHCGRRFGDSSSLCRHYRMHVAKGEGGKPAKQ